MKKLICAMLMLYSINTFAANCKVNDPDIAGEYSGGCQNGLAHGEGVAQGRDKYEGSFENGNKHGKGIYTWSNGNRYEGECRDDLWNGKGIYTASNGGRYEGDWKDGKRDGQGTGKFSNDGSTWVGGWKNDKVHGHGRFCYKNNDCYNLTMNNGESGLDPFSALRDLAEIAKSAPASNGSTSSTESHPELCAIAYQKDGKAPSYYEGICRNHPRSKEKWNCIINQMNKGKSMFMAESYCGA